MVIIDSYRGGTDTGIKINNKYEKDYLLELSKYMSNSLYNKGIDNILIRDKDINISEIDRINNINNIKNKDDIIVENRYIDSDGIEIVYPLRSDNYLVSMIVNKLESNNIKVNKYYQLRLPSSTDKDYYKIISDTSPNMVLIIYYNDIVNYKGTVNIIVDVLSNYIGKSNTYIVKKGDTLYSISKKYGISIDELKKLNNIKNNSIYINQVLYIDYIIYKVNKGDSLYKIAKKYNTTVDKIKKLNNIKNNLLSINQELKIPNI